MAGGLKAMAVVTVSARARGQKTTAGGSHSKRRRTLDRGVKTQGMGPEALWAIVLRVWRDRTLSF